MVLAFSGADFVVVVAGAPAVGERARFFSTTTALVRPWLKLCLTVDVSVFLSDRVFPVRPAGAELSFVSLIRVLFPGPWAQKHAVRRAEILQAAPLQGSIVPLAAPV